MKIVQIFQDGKTYLTMIVDGTRKNIIDPAQIMMITMKPLQAQSVNLTLVTQLLMHAVS